MTEEIKIVNKVVPRRREGGAVYNIYQGGSAAGGGTAGNASHADSAYTLDGDTPVRDWFLSKEHEDVAAEVIDFLKGVRIAGSLFNRIVKKDDTDISYTDTDMMSAMRVMRELDDAINKLNDRFLRKDQPDQTTHLLKLLGGLVVDGKLTELLKGATFGNYQQKQSGGCIDEAGVGELKKLLVREDIESTDFKSGALGTGFLLKTDPETGRSYLEVDELLVRIIAVFIELEIRKLSYAGGNWVFSAAGGKCARVEELPDRYRCYLVVDDGKTAVENEFRVGDQVQNREFNIKSGVHQNVSNRYYWRLVVGVGEDYIDLSKSDCDKGSVAPIKGDAMVQFGNRTDVKRQNAIVISAYGEGSPSITQHKGINSYSLAGTEKTRISPDKNVFTGEFHFESGVNVEEQVGSQGEQILEALEQAAENNRFANAIKKDVDAIKNQVDGIIETWFLDPVPTLSNKPAVDWTTDVEKQKHIGDMYYDANGKAYRFSDRGGKYQWETITDSDIIKALEAAKKAQDTADGKRRVFVEIPSLSSVYDVGDLWVNATYASYKNELLRCKSAKKSGIPFDISHWEKACSYTDDTVANNAVSKAEQAKKDAEAAKNEADAANANANKANALLSDIANDNKLTAQEKQQTKKEWDIILSEKPKNDASADRYGVSKVAYGTAYASLSAYITPLLDSLTTTSNIVGADFRGKFKAYYDARTDLLNAISAKTKEIADAAQSAADAAAQKAQQALEQVIENKNFANAIKKDLDALKNQVDGVIETWFFDPVPTLSNKPAVDWTTESEKQKHIGDLYYDANGKAYRFSNRSGKYQWEVLADSDIAKALEAAKKAQDTADGKRRVFVTVPTASNAYDVGDLWVNATYANYKNELLRCKSAKKSGVPFDISHWEKACSYTDDTTANQAAMQAEQAKKDAAIAQNNANTAMSNANKANGMLADIASDSKLTASEKQQTKKEWDIIVSEKPKNDASADRYGVSKTAYGAAYSALSAYITPLLSSLSTTSDITGNTFRANFKAYYDARTDLLNAVSAKSKQIADAAQEAADAAADKAQQALEQAIENIKFSNAIKKDLDALKNQVDGVIETWFFDPVPTLTNQPAVNWNTTEEKQKHIGDLYYDKNGKAYRFSNRGGTFQWEVLADSDIIKALEAAKKAQDTADGKRRVFVAAPTTSNAYDVGDLWVNATYGSYVNELLKCKTAKSSGAAFSISHWEKACKYTDDTVANAAVQKAQQAKEAADVAQNSANKAKQDAVQALDKLTEIADDNKFTASEKQQTKKEWDIIVSEKPKNDASADRYGVSKAAYGTAYNSLSAYITPLLATLTTTSSVVGTDFRRNFKAYYDARTDLLNAISSKAKELADRAQQEAGQAASKAEQAKADAAAAQSKANSAYSVADAAKNRLNSWAADGSISPVEKHAIKDEITRIDADKSEILADYNRYKISSPSHFVSQHAAYRGMLVSLSAATPETIAIPSGFAAQQKSYYDARTACLNAIANAAKKHADDIVGALRTETKASIDALNNKITLKVDSSTFNSLKQQVQAQGSELQLAKDAIKSKVSQSTFDAEREKQNILAACTDANMITDDPSFARGTNDIIVYNNTSNGAVTITRKAGSGVNSSNYYLDIAAAATGSIEPGYGGFTFRYQTKARLRLVCRFSAWLDKGRRFEFATNAIGDNSRHFWLTDNQGRGTWADYAYYVECGTGGSFSTTFFFYVMGGGRPVSTWLSYATIHMLSADADFKHRLSTAETKITQTANSISLKADKSYVDGINTRLSSAEIALNPDQIWMKVSEKVNGAIGDRPTREEIKAGIGVTTGGVTVFGKTISLNGVVTFASLASDAQGKINTAQNTATAAQNTANTARSEKITLARLEGTVIDGGHIKTSLIDVKSLFAEEITATRFNLAGGSIGGFEVNSGYLGLNQASSEEGMSLYSTGVYFRSPNKKVFLGTEMSAFMDQLLHLENTDSSYLPHIGLKFNIKGQNANNNFAFVGYGNGALNGFIEGYMLNYIDFSADNQHHIISFAHGKYVEINVNRSGCAVYLPRLTSLRDALGISAGKDFAVRMTIVHRAGRGIRLYGRRNYSVGSTNFNTSDFPWLRNNNFGNEESWELGTGDCVEVLLTYSINEYNAYTVNIHR